MCMNELGWDNMKYGIIQDFAQEVAQYKDLAEKGDELAQFKLGECYSNGRGVEQDYAKAVYWYTKSAEQGNAKVNSNLSSAISTVTVWTWTTPKQRNISLWRRSKDTFMHELCSARDIDLVEG